MADHIELDLPLHARHAATARAVAASVASEVGLSIDEIDDLRLGVNEAISVMTDIEQDTDEARLIVRFDLESDTVRVTVRRVGVDEVVDADHLDALASRILRAVVDEFGIDDSGVFRLLKRRGVDGGH
ncbi:MAG: ATP-binding protein [Ilumatobacteraceae bacterium]